MPDWLVAVATYTNLAGMLAWGVLLVRDLRRYKRAEHAQFLRWKAIEEEQMRAWRQRRLELLAACPGCGLARAEDDA